MTPCPGEVYWAFSDKRRPVVVVSREELNRGEYVVVVPLTTARLEVRRKLPNCVPIQGAKYGLKDCVAQAEMISALSRSDLLDPEKGPIAKLDGEMMRGLIRAVGYVVGAEVNPA